MPAIIGKKLGMTQVFQEDGTVVPVTVIEAGPCPVTAIRDPERDGYAAVQLAFGDVPEAKLSKAELGHLAKADAGAKRTVVEFRDAELGGEEEPKIGDTVTVDSFEPGQQVKVSGVGIGKGFAGTIKRHNFHRGPVSHGSHNVRAPGLDRRQRRPRPRLQGHQDAGPDGRQARHPARPRGGRDRQRAQPAADQGLGARARATASSRCAGEAGGDE